MNRLYESGFKIILLAIVITSCYSCHLLTNGCSTPTSSNFWPYRKDFKSACNRHDICYRCGDHYNWSRRACDHAFLRDMKTLCKRNHASKKSCLFTSTVYHKAVVFAGRFFYRKPSMKFCYESCVKKYGDPAIGV